MPPFPCSSGSSGRRPRKAPPLQQGGQILETAEADENPKDLRPPCFRVWGVSMFLRVSRCLCAPPRLLPISTSACKLAGLLSHANVPGRDLPHREDDVEKPKASEEDPRHHLRFKMSRSTEWLSFTMQATPQGKGLWQLIASRKIWKRLLDVKAFSPPGPPSLQQARDIGSTSPPKTRAHSRRSFSGGPSDHPTQKG